ncbi:MAG: FtsW/RodA/SpoVE family cell cycle protein [Candidatus Hydrothermia bacterium]
MYFNTGSGKLPKKIDILLITTTIFLTLLGFLMSYSATFYKFSIHGTSTIKFLTREFFRLLIGIIAFFVGKSINPKLYRKYTKPAVVALLAVLILTFLLGVKRLGAIRWIRLGFLSFQPSELAKLVLVLYLADALSSSRESLKNFKELLKVLVVPVLIFGLVAIQPNLSTAMIIFFITVGILYIAGLKFHYILIPILSGFALAVFFMFAVPGKFSHVKSRITRFVQGNEHYQVKQARIAISQGGLFGKGIGKGTQKYLFLPYAENDFMFALVAEELGLFWATILILAYALITIKGLFIAERHIKAKYYYSLLSAGVSLMIFTSSAVHIAVNLGLIPPTGQTLPLLSVGGSSLMVNLFALGMLEYLSEDAERYEVI